MSLDAELYMMVDTGAPEPHRVELFWTNYTHNIISMAEHINVYGPVWRPEENGIDTARQLIPYLKNGILNMQADKDQCVALNPENGWGCYDTFLAWLQELLDACKQHPKALYRASV